MSIDELFPELDTPPAPAPPLSVYCPGCGAYLMTLGLEGPWECELCGCQFAAAAESRSF